MRRRIEDYAAVAGFVILAITCVLSPWGELMRWEIIPESTLGRRGIPTLFALVAILVSVLSLRFFRKLAERPRLLWYALFVLLATLASLPRMSPQSALILGGTALGYWLLAVAVASFALDDGKARALVMLYALSASAMALVTLIDNMGIVDFPSINEGMAYYQARAGLVKTVTGPFRLRTEYAVYLAVAWSALLAQLALRRPRNWALWLLCVAALAVVFLASVVAYTRSLYLVIVFSLLYLATVVVKTRRIQIVVTTVLVIVGLIILAQQLMPAQFAVVEEFITRYTPEYITRTRGDMVRVEALVKTLEDLRDSPLGMGFTLTEIYGGRGYLDTHSIYTEHLRQGGFIGLLFVALFIWPVFKAIARRSPAQLLPVLTASAGWLVYGLFLGTQSMLFGWVLIGLIYGAMEHSSVAVRTSPRVVRRFGPVARGPAVAGSANFASQSTNAKPALK